MIKAYRKKRWLNEIIVLQSKRAKSHWGDRLAGTHLAHMDINATQEIWSFVSKYNLNGLIDCNTSIVNQFNIINNKKIIMITDILARETKEVKTSHFILL